MKHEIELPDPWEHVATLSPNEQGLLESIAGSKLTFDDLSEHDVNQSDIGKHPSSRKSWFVMGHRWNRIRNSETGEEIIVRLQTFDGRTSEISSVIFPLDMVDTQVTGARLRGFPVAAISAAYSYDEAKGLANIRTFFEVVGEGEKSEPLDKLPRADSSELFAALVARQYRQLEKETPDVNVAKAMAKLNEKPLPTVQRWIALARKKGYLAPAPQGRRNG